MDWKRKGEVPTHGKWWLREVKIRDKSSWLMFARIGKDDLVDLITVMVQGGKAWPLRAGRRQSMKHERRVRVTNLASQVIAYVTLMGGGQDFPPVDEI
jgi:hypothetical protein